jgi:lactoylglutathione lyase
MIQFIIYVSNQNKSRDFYANVLNLKPALDVPGMTEFKFSDNCKLGIMPENSIAKILGSKTRHPSLGSGIPRCEIYLYVDNIEEYYSRALLEGANEISPQAKRDWGDTAAYVSDPDGHIIAFAKAGY